MEAIGRWWGLGYLKILLENFWLLVEGSLAIVNEHNLLN